MQDWREKVSWQAGVGLQKLRLSLISERRALPARLVAERHTLELSEKRKGVWF